MKTFREDLTWVSEILNKRPVEELAFSFLSAEDKAGITRVIKGEPRFDPAQEVVEFPKKAFLFNDGDKVRVRVTTASSLGGKTVWVVSRQAVAWSSTLYYTVVDEDSVVATLKEGDLDTRGRKRK